MKHLGKNLVIVIALVAAGFFLAYLRFRPYLGQESGYTDGERRYAGDTFQDVRYAVWEDPEALGGEVNSPGHEGRPAISPDGRWMVFPVGERGLNSDLWIAEIVDGEPRDPQPLPAVNSDRDEWAPAFGGDALYFASDRPGTLGGLDLFRASYRDGVFGPAEVVGPGVNSAYDDTDPAPLPGSRALAFASDRPRGARRDFDLWLAGPDGLVEPLAALNTPFEEREPAFVGDARTILFASDRSGGAGGFDLYRSVSDRGEWLPCEGLPGLNGPASERGPAPSPDGFALLFAVEDGEGGAGGSDLYRARSRELFPVPGKPIGWVDLAVFASLLLLALLAWLAKRWEAMDLLYKCVMAAVVLHILLLLWFRGLYPDGSDVDLPERDALFRIKLAAVTAPSRAAHRAFGGELDTDRSAVVVAEPLRTRAEFEDAPVEAAPERRVTRTTAEVAAAPDRLLAEHARSEQAAAAETVEQMRTPEEAFERRSEQAPRLTVQVSERADGAERSPMELANPARADSARLAEDSARPSLLAQERQAARLVEAPRFTSAAADAETPDRSEADPRSALAVATPVERVERFTGEARDLDLAEATATRRETGRSLAEPERRGGARADLLAAAAGEPDMAARGPLAMAEAELDAPLERQRAELQPRASEMPLVAMRADSLAPADPAAEARAEPAPEMELIAASAAEALDRPQRQPGSGPARRAPSAAQAGAGAASPGALAMARAEQRRLDAGGAPAAAELELRPGGRGVPNVELRAVREATVELAATEQRAEALPLLAARSTPRPERRLDAGPRRRPGRTPVPESDGQALPDDTRFERAVDQPIDRGTGASSTPGFSPRQRELPSIALRGGDEPFEAAERTEAAVGAVAMLSPPAALAPEHRSRSDAGPRRLGKRTLPEPPAEELAPAFRAVEVAESAEPVALAGPERLEHTPYKNRFGVEKEVALREFGGSVETEAAVAAGLAYLARIQSSEGYWGSAADKHEKYRHVVIGKTGLGLLAFLGAGHTQQSGSEYSAVAERAIGFLLAVQDPQTGHFGDSNAYSHGVTTYALAECYALTRDERLRAPLEKAVAWILRKQARSRNPERDGGWGYYYPDGEVWQNDTWPRVSVTSWQVMALESARIGGLEVPDRAFEAARGFLRRSVDREQGWFRYSHDPARLRSSYPTLPASTPAGLFAASLLGENLDEAHYARARAFLSQRAPDGFRFDTEDAFVYQATGNLYFWYYGTLASFRIGGADWDRWNERMKVSLLEGQEADGSWRPISLYARYAGDDNRDRSYTTAMCVLSLEIYYRYFTPLLQVR